MHRVRDISTRMKKLGANRKEEIAARKFGVSKIMRWLFWRNGLTIGRALIPPGGSKEEGKSKPMAGRQRLFHLGPNR